MDLSPASDQIVVQDTPLTEIAWLGPYPTAPEASYEQREAVELAFVAALQHLPGNQRAALLLFEVLGFSAAEIADMMATSTTSVNSALARARRLVAERVPTPQRPTAETKEIVAKYAAALEQGDAATLVALLAADVTWSMPPMGRWYRGAAQVTAFIKAVPMVCGSWHHVAVTANRPTSGGVLPEPRPVRTTPCLVHRRPHRPRRPDNRGDVVHRRGTLHTVRPTPDVRPGAATDPLSCPRQPS